jgi:hypothetical protein
MNLVSPGGLLLAALLIPSAGAAEQSNSYAGFWELSYDEDGTPKDTMEIRGDGTYISHGWRCQTADVIPYHLYNGDMYAMIEIPSKGPISIVFRHNGDGRISFTSPKSGKNAYYSRLERNPCPGNRGIARKVVGNSTLPPTRDTCDFSSTNWSGMHSLLHDIARFDGPDEFGVREIVRKALRGSPEFSVGDFEVHYARGNSGHPPPNAEVCFAERIQFEAVRNTNGNDAGYVCDAHFTVSGKVTSLTCERVAG